MKEFYKEGLRAENIYNLSVLTQAWKKINIFMRNDNWYTDFLELDNYSFNLEKRISNLSSNFNNEILKRNEIDLIPVPKNNPWKIGDTWNIISDCSENSEPIELRRVAKISIDNQIFSMSVLMNLAELVENMQGYINSDPIISAQKKVYSYGNRLDCHWEFDGEKFKSYFKTGSKDTYEKYQKNYNLFINRPTAICKYYNEGLDLSKKMVIVSLDLKNFYDSIHLPTLYKKVDALVPRRTNSDFLKYVSSILKWTNNDEEFNGLPQGLAASGFFANLFLIDFDNAIGKQIVTLKKNEQKSNNDSNFIIRDYCRYVDDLRIVLEVKKDQSVEEIKSRIHEIVDEIITSYYPGTDLKLRDSKTKVSEYLSSNIYPISNDLIMRRQNLSGTPSVEDIKENINAFKHLLLMEQINSGEQPKKKGSLLGEFEEIKFDLKNTTIQRFATTELKRNIKVSNTYKKNSSQNKPLGEIKEKEVIAKLLIRNWLYNPSLIYLLKTALEIQCSISLIKPILDTLLEKISEKLENKQHQYIEYEYATAVYVSSQILTYTVTNLESLKDQDVHSQYIDFKEYLVSFALNILDIYKQNKSQQIPWYLMQAVTFFLVSENRHFEFEEKNFEHRNLRLYHIYKDVSHYIVPNSNKKDKDQLIRYLSMAIVYYQVSKEREKFAAWYIKLISGNSKESPYLNYLLFNYDMHLFKDILDFDKYYNEIKNKKFYEKYFEIENGNSFIYKNNQQISLAKIILSSENPFKYENALLLLLSNLLKEEHAESLKKPVFLNDINVTCENWTDIQNPNKYTDEFFKIKFTNKVLSNDIDVENNPEKKLLLENFPFWLNKEGVAKTFFEKEFLKEYIQDDKFDELAGIFSDKFLKYSLYLEERKILYSIGKIMKSALIGNYDYTNTCNNKCVKGYFGIKDTIFSRSFGLNISLETLSNGESPISPWLVDVLFNNLKWPYAYRTREKDMFFSYKGLKKQIKEIIEYQKRIYGTMSNLPINVYPISNRNLLKKDTIRVASVQTMMPFMKDFDAKNPLYFSSYRNKHREHLINLTHLIEKHFSAQEVNAPAELKVNLIIFPELSIHSEDVDLLVKLSKKTGASIFAGLTFTSHPREPEKIINRAIWILNETLEDGSTDIKKIYQGKYNVTKGEANWGIDKYRPYQVIIDLKLKSGSCKISGSICYDSTDINLAADLKNLTDTYIVAAMNKDVATFDNMASALSYHMYQPVIIVNTGEYGGSTVQAPYSGYEKLIAHLHGNKQLGISIFDISPNDFKSIKDPVRPKKRKTPPANYPGRND